MKPGRRSGVIALGGWRNRGHDCVFHFREYSTPALFHARRMSVDAYACQHPGRPGKQSTRSVGMHLVRLYLIIERGLDIGFANEIMLALSSHKDRFEWLDPPSFLGSITVADVASADTVESHRAALYEWARSAWEAWAPHHVVIRERAALISVERGQSAIPG